MTYLYRAPVTSAGDRFMARRLAQMKTEMHIRAYALRLKLGFPDARRVAWHVGYTDVVNALRELNGATGAFADQQFGNGDGVSSPQEIGNLRRAMKENVNLSAFQRMYLRYMR